MTILLSTLFKVIRDTKECQHMGMVYVVSRLKATPCVFTTFRSGMIGHRILAHAQGRIDREKVYKLRG